MRCRALWILATALKKITPAREVFASIADPGCGSERLIEMPAEETTPFDPNEFLGSAVNFFFNCK